MLHRCNQMGLAWLGLAWLGLAWLGLAWLGLAWLGLAWLGLAWLGLAYLCLAGRGIIFLILATRQPRTPSYRPNAYLLAIYSIPLTQMQKIIVIFKNINMLDSAD